MNSALTEYSIYHSHAMHTLVHVGGNQETHTDIFVNREFVVDECLCNVCYPLHVVF